MRPTPRSSWSLSLAGTHDAAPSRRHARGALPAFDSASSSRTPAPPPSTSTEYAHDLLARLRSHRRNLLRLRAQQEALLRECDAWALALPESGGEALDDVRDEVATLKLLRDEVWAFTVFDPQAGMQHLRCAGGGRRTERARDAAWVLRHVLGVLLCAWGLWRLGLELRRT